VCAENYVKSSNLLVALHGTVGSYLRNALQEGSAKAVAKPPCSSGLGLWGFFLLVSSPFCIMVSTAAISYKEFLFYMALE
jgi:hypothetical protein